MKILFKATTLIALWNMLFFTFTYIAEKQWENAMCWAACAFMVIACRWYEWKDEQREKFVQFLRDEKCQEMVAKLLKNKQNGADKENGTDGNGREQE